MVISAVEAGQEPRTRRTRRVRALGRSRIRWRWFILPSLVLLLTFFVLPFVLNIPFAFSAWSSYSDGIPFVGFDNFTALWEDGTLRGAMLVTLAYAVIAMLVQNTAALSLALALQHTNRINTLFRSVFFVPVLMSPLAAGYIWRAIVAPDGPLNQFVGLFSSGFDFAWLGHPVSALVGVAFIDAWKWSGLATLVYIAGLNSVPTSLLEAAEVDGAGRARRFFRIQFPLLAPAFTFNIATTLIGALSAYDIIAATTSGGPGTATTTLNVALQQQFKAGFLGSASSLGLAVTVLVIGIAVPLVAWLRKREVA
ncbi:carbohydrate ABC transporter permease [Kribbella speibonae]|uniref:Sugar ABC transporter permease n=1 Tax=Kribbella speibonae TaxID=1572660 RepID=A0A4R0IY06_9ACTN|nr:sugar ABC transporter permease [Kribbella speibonae]TCC36478.1 sugar ABC transporter permease [Kribbella speibonae]